MPPAYAPVNPPRPAEREVTAILLEARQLGGRNHSFYKIFQDISGMGGLLSGFTRIYEQFAGLTGIYRQLKLTYYTYMQLPPFSFPPTKNRALPGQYSHETEELRTVKLLDSAETEGMLFSFRRN